MPVPLTWTSSGRPSEAMNVWAGRRTGLPCLRTLEWYSGRMKVKKQLCLSKRAVAQGELLAREQGIKLSALVEKQLLAASGQPLAEEEFWPGPALKPIRRAGDRRHDYLRKHHA